jgi:hypothetical protein
MPKALEQARWVGPKLVFLVLRVPFNNEEERRYRQIEQPVMDML